MIKVVDSANEVIETGRNIADVIEKLNGGAENGNEWFYVYRPDAVVINGYFGANEEEAMADVNGENADATYDVVEED